MTPHEVAHARALVDDQFGRANRAMLGEGGGHGAALAAVGGQREGGLHVLARRAVGHEAVQFGDGLAGPQDDGPDAAVALEDEPPVYVAVVVQFQGLHVALLGEMAPADDGQVVPEHGGSDADGVVAGFTGPVEHGGGGQGALRPGPLPAQ